MAGNTAEIDRRIADRVAGSLDSAALDLTLLGLDRLPRLMRELIRGAFLPDSGSDGVGPFEKLVLLLLDSDDLRVVLHDRGLAIANRIANDRGLSDEALVGEVADFAVSMAEFVPSKHRQRLRIESDASVIDYIASAPRGVSVGDRLDDVVVSWLDYLIKRTRDEATDLRRRFRRIDELDLSDNNLSEIPSDVFLFESLDRLSCARNAIAAVPADIQQLNALRDLDLSENRIATLHPNLGRLAQLRFLDLSDNKLIGLPASLLASHSLKVIVARRNEIARIQLPRDADPAVEELVLSDNRLKGLPRSLSRLSRLQVLELEGNEIATIPSEIEQLTSLRSINLGGNRLTKLPTAIGGLARLEFLDVSDNELTALPVELSHLAHEVLIEVAGNPLPVLVRKTATRGTRALLQYLASLETPTNLCLEGKLIVVGEGNVGKTSLIAALRKEQFAEDRATTHGIEVRTVGVTSPVGPVRLNAWDFGGQEVYRVTHPFFFSDDALYLVVWRPREGFEQSGVEYWLRSIFNRIGDRARVVLVSTYAQEGRHAFLDYASLAQKFYPILRGYVSIDNSDGTGIAELQSLLGSLAGELPHVREPIAETWQLVRSDLSAIKTPFLDRHEFDQFCEVRYMDTDAADTWINLLHDLGHLIYFRGDLGLDSAIVLDPEILAKAVSFLMEDEGIRLSQGVAAHSRLAAIWQSNLTAYGLDRSRFAFLLRLMEKYEISYRIDGTDSSLLAPTVPHERPPGLSWGKDTGTKQLRMTCEMSDAAAGLIPWLIIRHEGWTTGDHWQAGLHLRNARHRAEARIEVSDTRLDLSVRGEYPNETFAVLVHDIDYLLRTRWANLSYSFFVPCSQFEDADGCVGRFPFTTLVKASAQGRETVECQECLERQPVSRLLTGLDSRGPEVDDRVVSLLESVGRTEQLLTGLKDSTERLGDRQHAIARVVGTTETSLRQLTTLVGEIVVDCPRLFTIAPADMGRWRQTMSWQRRYQLSLWCEEPNEQHPCDDPYVFSSTKEQITKLLPAMRLMSRVLRLVPLVVGMTPGPLGNLKTKVEGELDLMQEVVDALKEVSPAKRVPGSNAGAAKGYELRVLRELLREIDPPPQRFAGLTRVAGSGGEVLWVCPEHLSRYDPGLPTTGALA